MDWSQELLDSLFWIARFFGVTIALLLLTGFILIRKTRWGQQFWSIGGDYLNPRRNPRALLLFLLILFLTLFGVRLDVLFSNWYNNMYSALQEKNESVFWVQMLVFSVLATIHVVRALISSYLQERFSIKWRESLNDELLGRWMHRDNFYRLSFLQNHIDNPDQRIQQDVDSFVKVSLGLVLGCISNLVSAIAFTVILWNLAGPLTILGYTLPKGMVFMLFIYVLVATWLAFGIGRPLIRLNFLNERFNANYRYALIRVREYAESIAFYAGAQLEKTQLTASFKKIIQNYWNIVFRSLKFQGFNLAVSQTAVIFPFIIQAPRFFSGQLSLGGMVQTAQSFGTLQTNLSFFRQSYDTFASFKATLDRLTGFMDSLKDSEDLPAPQRVPQERSLSLQNVSIWTPSEEPLISGLTFQAIPGDRLLIQGNSGTGKTTLLRTLAGLWPYSSGQIAHPKGSSLFMAQKPYLPQGSIVDILYYPEPAPPPAETEALVRETLQQISMPHLIDQMHVVKDWSQTLSVGEQQRLAFGRLFMAKPDIIYLDEATSAMDEGLEYQMYSQLCELLPDSILISVGHRSTLRPHHNRLLTIAPDGGWKYHKSLPTPPAEGLRP